MTDKDSQAPLAVGDRVRLIHGLWWAMPNGGVLTEFKDDGQGVVSDNLMSLPFAIEDIERIEEGADDEPSVR